jgi:hypothetical protein
MWEPVGPLPASVYWRRRWVAIGSAASVLVLLGWAASSAVAGLSGDGTTTRPAARAAVSAPQEVSPSPAAPAAVLARPGPEGPLAPGVAGRYPGTGEAPYVPPAQADPGGATAEVPGTLERLMPDDTPRESSPVPSPAAVPPTGPVPCTNDMLKVITEVDRPVHGIGERPLLRLVVINTSDQPCVRDLDPARQEIVVWSADGSDRLWSSNDCSTAAGVDLRTLVPGQPVASSVRWAGRTSAPGCPDARSTVPAGEYRVLSRVDDVISEPTMMRRY